MGDIPKSYVWGPINAEDLVDLPGTRWIITSGMTGPGSPHGRLYAVDREDASCNEIFPYLLTHELDAARFGAQKPLVAEALKPHGIDVKIRHDGVAELFVVNHGARESVEVFEILLDAPRPRLRWIGGAALPDSAVGNDVAAVAGGGFVVSTMDGQGQASISDGSAEPNTGGVLEWSPTGGWSLLPGTQIYVANGVAVSPDGEWVFIGGWGACTIRKVRRGVAVPEAVTVPAPIRVDNLTWSASGVLLAAGAFDTPIQAFAAAHISGEAKHAFPTRLIRIDPDSLVIDVLVEYSSEAFGVGTTALHVGDEIWVGSAHDQGLARFNFPAEKSA